MNLSSDFLHRIFNVALVVSVSNHLPASQLTVRGEPVEPHSGMAGLVAGQPFDRLRATGLEDGVFGLGLS